MNNIDHPSHYNIGSIEVIDVIEDWNLNFHRGNAVKYIARAGKKNADKEIEDLEKAAWYINREIQRIKNNDNMSDVNRCICCGEIIPEGIQICPQCAGAK